MLGAATAFGAYKGVPREGFKAVGFREGEVGQFFEGLLVV